MPYDLGPAIPPMVGACFNLRAGLECFVESQLNFHGIPMFSGTIVGEPGRVILWHATGHYSPTRQKHELDLVSLIDDRGS